MEFNLDNFLKPADQWDRKYLDAVAAAIRQYQPDHAGKTLQRYLSKQHQAEMNLTNTYARRIYRRALLTAARSLERRLFGKGVIVMWASIAPATGLAVIGISTSTMTSQSKRSGMHLPVKISSV